MPHRRVAGVGQTLVKLVRIGFGNALYPAGAKLRDTRVV